MPDIWTVGPTATAFALRLRGFTARAAERLVGVFRRAAHGEFAELSAGDKKRAVFICWLIDTGRLSDERTSDTRRPGAAWSASLLRQPAAPAQSGADCTADCTYERRAT